MNPFNPFGGGGNPFGGGDSWKLPLAMALSNLGKPAGQQSNVFDMYRMQMMQNQMQEEQAKKQAQAKLMGGYDPVTKINWNANPNAPDNKQLAIQSFPDAAGAAIAQQHFKAPLSGKDRFVNTDVGLMDLGEGGNTPTPVPNTAKPLGASSSLGKLQEDLKAGRITQQQYDAAVRKETYIAPQDGGSSWRVMTKQEAESLGLNPTGTYKTNGKDFQVMTQPKQDAPTQGQNTAAYHGRRLATAIGTLKDVLSKNPDSATSIIPGNNPASKMMRGDDENRVQAALPEIGDALLTLGTGAAYTTEQFKNQWQANLPAVGDSDQVLQDKFGRIQALYEQAKVNAGPAGVTLPDISSLAEIYKNRTPPRVRNDKAAWKIERIQ